MAARSAVLAVRIVADASQARRELSGTGQAVGGFTGALGKAKGPALAAVAAIGLVGGASTAAASELQQSTGAVQSIFGKYASTIITNAKAAATAVGLSQSAFQTQSVMLGSQLKNLGTPIDQVAGKTTDLIKRAADMAATFGGPTSDAVEAISSLMRGESDPIERYGVSINQAAIQAFILSHHLANTTQAQQKQAKQTAILSLLYKQTSATAGQFSREQKTAAGASEIAAAQFENAKAALGAKLLPVVAEAKRLFGQLAQFVARNSGVIFTLVGIVGGLAVAILAANVALKAYRAAQAIAAVLSGEQAAATGAQTIALGLQKAALAVSTAAQWAFNAAMSANPLAAVIALIVLLVGAFVLAYRKSATFRAIVSSAFAAVMTVVRPFVSFFTKTIPAAFQAVVSGLHTAWNAVVAFIRTWGSKALAFLAPFIGIPLVIYRHFGQIVGWLARVWSTVTRNVSSFVSSVVSAVTGIPGKLGRAASSFLHVGLNLIGAFFRGIGNAVSGAAGFALDIAQSIVNSIVRGINRTLDLPWVIKLHINGPGPLPDLNFGPYTLLPSIPLWSSAAYNQARPAIPPSPSLDQLAPGFTLFAAAAGWSTAGLAPSSSAAQGRDVLAPVKVVFEGLVTDPDAVARQIEDVLARRVNNVSMSSGRFR